MDLSAKANGRHGTRQEKGRRHKGHAARQDGHKGSAILTMMMITIFDGQYQSNAFKGKKEIGRKRDNGWYGKVRCRQMLI